MTSGERQPAGPSRTRSYFLVFAGILLVVNGTIGLVVLSRSLHHRGGPVAHTSVINSTSPGNAPLTEVRPKAVRASEQQCDFPLVYNKPPKTASTTIKSLLDTWAKKNNRQLYSCPNHSQRNETRFLECLPRKADRCGVMAFHFVLYDDLAVRLHKFFPNYRLMTSTRDPMMRIVSTYLQMLGVRLQSEADFDERGFQKYVQERFSPWSTLNYHSGDGWRGEPVMTAELRARIANVVARYDIIVDAALPAASNAILLSHGLLPLRGKEANVRGTRMVQLRDDTQQMIHRVIVVELAMRYALLKRMAHLYGEASGDISCTAMGSISELTECLLKSPVTVGK